MPNVGYQKVYELGKSLQCNFSCQMLEVHMIYDLLTLEVTKFDMVVNTDHKIFSDKCVNEHYQSHAFTSSSSLVLFMYTDEY